MRIFPRIRRPSLKPVANRLRRLRRHLSVARVAAIIEWLIFSGVLLFALTSGRTAFIDSFGHRADVTALALALCLLAVLHAAVKRYLLPRIERYFSPVRYDERRILFDLGQEARRATDIDHLFGLIVGQIGGALQAADASLFVRDDATGDYVRRASSSQSKAQAGNGFSPGADLADGKPEAEASDPLLMLARDAFIVRRLRSMARPMEIGPQDFEAWDRFLDTASASQRSVRQKERDALMHIKTRLLMPISSRDQLVGFISLGQCRARHEYDAGDRELLMSVGSQLALVIENSRLTDRIVADEKLRRELALAAEVQRRLLPVQAPECDALELAGFCQPARGVGGDYYDFFKLDDRQVGIAIADVAGKGIAAALQMSTVQATLRSLVSASAPHHLNGDSVAMTVGTLNRLLRNSTGGANYVTFFYAEFDDSTRQLAYVNAGHNPPILFRANGKDDYRQLSCGGMFVGMFEHCGYEQEIVQMQPGDVLIGFTDGLSEALNVKGEEFGEERIRATLAATRGLAINKIRDEVVRRANAWCAGAPQHDDLTFIVMRVKNA
jgi:sigma-B regulation protein RsbU (phosphoserine phosphatase)